MAGADRSPSSSQAQAGALFFAQVDEAAAPPHRRLTWRIGDAVREVIERLVDTTAPDDDLDRMAAELEGVVGRLRRFSHGRRYETWAEASTAVGPGDGPGEAHLDFSPVLGRANPLAPPLTLRLVDGDGGSWPTVVGDVTFGSAYEGPPGCVHGGILAAAFDEVMGATQTLSGQPGMTGTLTVTYRSPTPLHQPLRFRSVIDRIEGRKIHVAATVTAGDRLCAEATGVFISVDFERLIEMQRKRDAG
ncbi:MAG: PaaI family thioesterase [Acidimicrobiales bacterium]